MYCKLKKVEIKRRINGKNELIIFASVHAEAIQLPLSKTVSRYAEILKVME